MFTRARNDQPRPIFNRAAFSPDDVEDSKRGYPDVDLRAYASARDMEFMDSRFPGGFRAALPGRDELRTNVLRGILPGGVYGVMAHQGLEVGYVNDGAEWGGTFYGVRVHLRGDAWPVFGSAPTGVARVPCTVAAARVPESAGTHPYMRIDTRRSSPPFSFTNRTKLKDRLRTKNWSLWCEPAPTPDTVARLVDGSVAELLDAHASDGLFQVVVWYGTLIVRRNGYLRSAEELDELANAASLMARRVRDVCLSLADPQPFTVELPRPLSSEALELPAGFYPNDTWRGWALQTRDRLGLALENPVAFHRAFPSAPVPGSAYVVLRGELPQIGPGRLVVTREIDAARAAVLVAQPSGAPALPPGGITAPGRGIRLESADGLLAAWSTTSYTGDAMVGDLDAFLTAAADALNQ